MDLDTAISAKCAKAREASRLLATLSSGFKEDTLKHMAAKIRKASSRILAANRLDLEYGASKQLSKAMMDRLLLNEERIIKIAADLEEVASLPDPVGGISGMTRRPNGLLVGRMRVPLGVVCIIYEARPNVTADAAGLCLKAGNAAVLRGGSEAVNSNAAIAAVLMEAAAEKGFPHDSVQFIESREREAVYKLLEMDRYIDVVIPRGGQTMIRDVIASSKVPVIAHGSGNCHTYIDWPADTAMAVNITFNAKVQRPGVCNATETLLVHQKSAPAVIPPLFERLKGAGVEIRGCRKTLSLYPGIKEAEEKDWSEEFLDLVLAVKIVEDFEEAVAHITRYSTGHTEAIITEDYANAMQFASRVDSASVIVNASTRFSDGNQFGLGAEIGISTQKLHARGPMGLIELTTTKFVVFGSGQVRE